MTSSLSILLKSCSTASFHFLDLFCAVIKGYYRDSTEESPWCDVETSLPVILLDFVISSGRNRDFTPPYYGKDINISTKKAINQINQ